MPTSGKESKFTDKQQITVDQITGWKFILWLLAKLPMGFIAGIRVKIIDKEQCVTTVPYRWFNTNPFKSMYFAVQSMAAELSTAAPCLVAITGQKPSVAFIIVNNKAEYFKKAVSKVYFRCSNVNEAFLAAQNCIDNPGEPYTVTLKTEGTMKDGTVVSRFEFTWSLKTRSS